MNNRTMCAALGNAVVHANVTRVNDLLSALLQQGVDINDVAYEQKSLLELACDRPHDGLTTAHLEIVNLLLAAGASCANDQAPLAVASQQGHLPLINLLLNEAGARVDHDALHAVLHAQDFPANSNLVKTALALIEAGAPVHPRSPETDGPLHLACAKRGDIEDVVTHLLERGARLDATNHKGETPLLCTAHSMHAKVARLLLQRGADPMHRDRDGNTFLHLATRNTDRVASYLYLQETIGHSGDAVAVRNHQGATPLRVRFLRNLFLLLARAPRHAIRRAVAVDSPLATVATAACDSAAAAMRLHDAVDADATDMESDVQRKESRKHAAESWVHRTFGASVRMLSTILAMGVVEPRDAVIVMRISPRKNLTTVLRYAIIAGLAPVVDLMLMAGYRTSTPSLMQLLYGQWEARAISSDTMLRIVPAVTIMTNANRDWSAVPTPCPGLSRALPALWNETMVSDDHADLRALVAHLPDDERALVQHTVRTVHHIPRDLKANVFAQVFDGPLVHYKLNIDLRS